MKGTTASMIALIMAGLFLLVVGGNSYSNYLRAQYEKEYGVLEKHRKVANSSPIAAVGQQGGVNVMTSTLDPGALPLSQSFPAITSTTPANSPQINQAPPAYRTGTVPPTLGAPPSPSQASVGVAAVDPEIARLQARLKAIEEESALYKQKLNQVRRGDSGLTDNQTESGTLREVLNQAGKGTSSALFPQEEASGNVQIPTKADFEKQIMNAPAAAKVVAFNADWGFVQIDAGKNRNISKGTRFAVRRGVSIVGYVKVTEVSDKTAIAELTSRNEFSETARKPKPGDDLISWPIF